MKTEWKNREGVLTLSACRKDFPLYIAWTMTYQREMGPPIWRNIVCRQKQNPKMALSKRCATRSDRRCNSVDVLLLSMAHHRTRQANGKSITAGARNKSNPSAEAYHQGKYAEDMLMAHVHSWGWVARHAPYDLIVPGGGVEQRVKVTAGGGPFSFKTQINTHINNNIYVNESSGGQQTCLSFFFSCVPLTSLQTWQKRSATRGEAKMAGGGGREEGGSAGPSGSGGTDVGRLAFGRGWELANANYCAKLLAKYVSPCHIRLLRGRFMVSWNSVFLKGGI